VGRILRISNYFGWWGIYATFLKYHPDLYIDEDDDDL
jgi:hypothetical protein